MDPSTISYISAAVSGVFGVGMYLYIQSREDKIMKAMDQTEKLLAARIDEIETGMNDIRMNYLKRFELLTEKLNEVKIEVVREIGEVKLLIQSKA